MSVGYSDSDSLSRDVRLLDHAVDELRDDLRRLDDRIDTELTDLRSDHDVRLDRIAADLADTTDTADSAATAAARLADRVEWLSRYIRLGHGATETDLDTVAEETVRDLTASAAGRHAASTLLPADRRHTLQATIDAAERTRDHWQDTTDTLLAASRALTKTPLDAPNPTALQPAAVRGPARRYRAAVTEHRAATAALDNATVPADRARHALSADDRQRAARRPTITAGETADTRARTRLRTRIAEALSSEALLPEWFVITLGFRPTHGTATSTWMDLATDVLAYRITYGITSHSDALGPDPTNDPSQPDDPERVHWHRRLHRALTT